MGVSDKLLKAFREEKRYLCRHPTCHKKFYTKEEMLKHYYPVHEGSRYDAELERNEIKRYRKGISRAEQKIAIEKQSKSYEIPGVDEVYIRSKPKYLRPKKEDRK